MAAQSKLAEVTVLLAAFAQWFGDARLRGAQAPFRAGDLSPLEYARQLQKRWVVRDLLAYLEARDDGALNEALVVERLMPLCRLASAVLRFDRAGAESVPGRFKDLLLGNSCADYAHEIVAAAHHDFRGFQIRWLPEGVRGGEFAARAPGGEEIFVECKRLAADAAEQLKVDEVTLIAEALDTALDINALAGFVRLDIGPRHIGRPALVETVALLADDLRLGRGAQQLDDVTIRFDLQPAASQRPYAELLALAASRDPVYRVITGRREGAIVTRPRVFELSGPKREGVWFARKIETLVLEEAADRQLSPESPGVVCLELPMFRDVEPDAALEIVVPVIDMLFERPHVIGLLAVLDLATHINEGIAQANARGRVIPNNASGFADAREQWFRLIGDS